MLMTRKGDRETRERKAAPSAWSPLLLPFLLIVFGRRTFFFVAVCARLITMIQRTGGERERGDVFLGCVARLPGTKSLALVLG